MHLLHIAHPFHSKPRLLFAFSINSFLFNFSDFCFSSVLLFLASLSAPFEPINSDHPTQNLTHNFLSLKLSLMAVCNNCLLLFLAALSLSTQSQTQQLINPWKLPTNFSLSFPLTSVHLSPRTSATLLSSLSSKPRTQRPPTVRSSFKFSRALIVSLPVGTPPQTQQMVLDTGSQLSWIQCHNKTPKKPPTTSFDPSLSSSFSVLPCNHPICKPRIPDFTLPTTCDQNRLCHYSYFYADGTFAEGNLVREKLTFSRSQLAPPVVLGCATESADDKGILGMNLGRLSFASQAKISRFSYCVPTRPSRPGIQPTGSFYLGANPNSATFRYVDLLTVGKNQHMPNYDPFAYTVGMTGIRIGGKRLNISASVFRPNAGGSGQTMIDSGSEYTLLVEAAYEKVREEVLRLVGPKLKKGYVFGEALDMCFDGGDAAEVARSVGDMVLEFEKGVEIAVEKERILGDVGGGVRCVGIGRSERLGVASNIIGNFHQQNLWVEFDLGNRRVGFGKADCSRSA